jgi:hypothetical protein
MKKTLSFSKISFGAALVSTILGVAQLPTVGQINTHPRIIVNSGSTNTCPYTISVLPSGKATYTVCNTEGTGEISSSLTTKFFDDISAAEPLSDLPYTSCAKSISFGTKTEIQYKHQTSPDVSCPSSDAKVTDLYKDAEAIQQELGFSVARR